MEATRTYIPEGYIHNHIEELQARKWRFLTPEDGYAMRNPIKPGDARYDAAPYEEAYFPAHPPHAPNETARTIYKAELLRNQ